MDLVDCHDEEVEMGESFPSLHTYGKAGSGQLVVIVVAS